MVQQQKKIHNSCSVLYVRDILKVLHLITIYIICWSFSGRNRWLFFFPVRLLVCGKFVRFSVIICTVRYYLMIKKTDFSYDELFLLLTKITSCMLQPVAL